MKVYFIGAGPGDPELITVKGLDLINRADIVIYAGSLVNPDLMDGVHEGTVIMDSAGMNLDEVTAIYELNRKKDGIIARVHTGDPALYGAIQEQIDFCSSRGIEWEVIPGVSSFSAASAALGQELTLPGISQTLIISRRAGRTPVPEGQSIIELAAHKATMALFLSISMMDELIDELKQGGYEEDTPMAVVYRASWPDQKIIRGTLADMAEKVQNAGVTRQAMILVGRSIGQVGDKNYELSRLYDKSFSHGYRKGVFCD
jgi:precorrin-4/cobalt-precorrin-4 C11-methyltransferase